MSRAVVYGIVIAVASLVATISGQACRRPDGMMGTCLSVYECPSVINVVQRGVSAAEAASLRRLSCTGDSGRFPWVCCELRRNNDDTLFPDDEVEEVPVKTAPTQAPTRAPPLSPKPTTIPARSGLDGTVGGGGTLPALGECGIDSLGQKIYGGTAAGINEFPWMALLEYKSDISNERRFGCSGALINPRYVLTAAHCLIDSKAFSTLKLVSVRLGEYEIGVDHDCVDDECSEPVIDSQVEHFIAHPQYNENSRNKAHDIGLVRLWADVKYSEFVRPICLPSVVNLGRSAPDKRLLASGWGRTLRARQSLIKQKVELPVVDQQTCVQKYAGIKAEISDQQLCAGGLYAVDTCDGDSGGPLMTIKDNYWTAEGIVSFGRGCGLEGWPAIYTRVSSYEDWIRQTITA